MDDLISRQAAIDEIKEFQHGAAEWRDAQEECSDIWHRADSAIASAIEIGLRVKKLPSAPQWIPCSERAPSELQECWFTGIDGMVYQGTFTRRHGERRDSGFICNGFQFAFLNAVVAWMPYEAPKAYKGEES